MKINENNEVENDIKVKINLNTPDELSLDINKDIDRMINKKNVTQLEVTDII